MKLIKEYNEYKEYNQKYESTQKVQKLQKYKLLYIAAAIFSYSTYLTYSTSAYAAVDQKPLNQNALNQQASSTSTNINANTNTNTNTNATSKSTLISTTTSLNTKNDIKKNIKKDVKSKQTNSAINSKVDSKVDSKVNSKTNQQKNLQNQAKAAPQISQISKTPAISSTSTPTTANLKTTTEPQTPAQTQIQTPAQLQTQTQAQPQSQAQFQPLSELLNQSLNYNSEFLAEKLAQDASYERSNQAKAAFLPSVRWNTNTQLGYQDPKNEPGFSTRGLNSSLNVQQSIYQADRFIALDQAKITRELAPLNVEIAKQNLWFKIVQNYFNTLKQIKTLETLEKKQKSIEQQRMYAQKSFDAGLTSITDVREAQSRLDNLLSQKITAQNQIDSQKKQLEFLTGADPRILQLPALQIDVEKVESYRQKTLKDVDLSKLNLLQIPSIAAAQLNFLFAEKEYEKAKKADYPTLDAYANAAYNTSTGGRSSQNKQKSAAIGLQLNVPLFTGTAKGIKQREMALLLSKAQQDSVGVQRRWQERYTLIMQNLDSLISQNKALLSAMQSNQANLSATQMAYKVGLRINIDVLNAQDQLYETQKQLSQNEYDLLIAVLELSSHLNRLEAQSHIAFIK